MEQLLEASRLNVVFAQLWRIVSEGQVRRKHFYATLREDEKSEFINKADSGVVRSRALTGFALPVRAVFDEGENLAMMGKLLADAG